MRVQAPETDLMHYSSEMRGGILFLKHTRTHTHVHMHIHGTHMRAHTVCVHTHVNTKPIVNKYTMTTCHLVLSDMFTEKAISRNAGQ